MEDCLKILGFFVVSFCLWPLFAGAEDALIMEGSLGASTVNAYSPQDAQIQTSGNTALLRLHVPLLQNKQNLFSFTISNQFMDSKIYDAETELTQFVSSSSIGGGFHYRYRFFSLGAEYHSCDFRQITVGNSSIEVNYTLALPVYYAGLQYRFGRLGLGFIYSLREVQVPAEKSYLSADRSFKEQNTAAVVSLYFEGSKSNFFKSLFKGN